MKKKAKKAKKTKKSELFKSIDRALNEVLAYRLAGKKVRPPSLDKFLKNL